MVKQTLFLDTHASTGPENLSYLASKVPNIRKSGSVTKDARALLERKAYVRIVDGLWKNPEMIVDIKEHFENMLEMQKTGAAGDRTAEKSTSVTLRTIDEAWVLGWLMRSCGICQATLEKVKDYDSEAIRHILAWALSTPLSLRLPDACKDTEIAAVMFDARIGVFGNRLQQLISNPSFIELKAGSIAWGRLGCYLLKFDEKGFACRVHHTHTKDEADIPPGVYITKQFHISCNWGDFNSFAELKPSRYHLHKFFLPTKTGPYHWPLWATDNETLKTSLKVAEEQVVMAREKTSASCFSVGGDFGKELKSQKAKATADKARTALRARMDRLAAKRMGSLEELGQDME